MADAKLNFTKRALDALPVPDAANKRKFYHDTQVRGLTICVLGTGTKVFYMYRWIAGKPKKIKVGPYPDLSIEQARAKAHAINATVAQGQDPTEATRLAKAEWTFGDLFAWYIENHAKRNKKTWNRDEDRYRNHLTHLKGTKLSAITRPIVRQLHQSIGASKSGDFEANRVLALIRGVYNKAIDHEIYAGINPAAGIPMFPEHPRDHRLHEHEIHGFLKALDEQPNEELRDFIKLLLYTGQRRSNVQAMRWDEVDFEACEWRIPDTKNGRPHTVPLGEDEMALLQARWATVAPSLWVFPANSKAGHMISPHKAWDAFRKKAGYPDLHLHDLRRTLGSLLAEAGEDLQLIGKTLGHLHPAATRVYAHLSVKKVRNAKAKVFDALKAAQ